MEIIVGKNAGFCYGVKRAVESAERDIDETKEKIYCLGEIVHNSDVVNELAQKGITFVENIDEVPENSTAIIRAHGVPKSVYEKAKERNIKLRDYTCSNVLKIHKIAETYAKNGYFIVLLGSSKHPENIGTVSFCGEHYFVVQDEEQILLAVEEINRWRFNKVLVISQTTFSLGSFYILTDILGNELYERVELVVENTICQATEIRQKETEELSKSVDCMIIIGGKNSSNTHKLFDIAKSNCDKTICIENVRELQFSDLGIKEMDNKSDIRIGIVAGASTPRKSIDEVIEWLES